MERAAFGHGHGVSRSAIAPGEIFAWGVLLFPFVVAESFVAILGCLEEALWFWWKGLAAVPLRRYIGRRSLLEFWRCVDAKSMRSVS